MNNDLRILISANLNIGKSLGDINNAIKAIETHPSLQKIKLRMDIDTSTLSGFISAVNQMKKISGDQSKVVKENVDVYKRLDGSIQKVTQSYLKNGEVITKTKTIHDQNKQAMQDESIAAKKLAESLEKQNKAEFDSITIFKNKANAIKGFSVTSSQGYTTTNQRFESDGQTLIGAKVTTNYKKQRQDELREQQQLNKEAEKLDRDHFMALRDNKKRNEDMEKLHFIAMQQNRQRDIDFRQSIAKEQAKIDDIRRRFGSDNNIALELDKLQSRLANTTNIGKYKNAIRDLEIELKKLVASTSTSGSHIDSLTKQFGVAISRTIIWSTTMGALYGSLHGLQKAIETIIQLDTQMVELKRVMDKDTDFDGMLKSSIALSNELGRSITEVNTAMIGFARQGFSEEQIKALTKTAVLATNISELSPDEATNAMTAAMTIFNIEASKSIRIIDSLNEVDNNFAVTTKDLAISLQKAGSTAKTFGVSMEEAIGDATSIMLATRESGAIAGNSLKTIYSRLTTMQPSIDALANIGINIKNANGEMKSATTILDEVAAKWNTLSTETQQNTAVTLAGRYQLSRFLAMMQNRTEAHKATETAVKSEGSAMRENAEYMKSLQARIEKMKSAFQGLALSLGDAVITDGIIAVVGTLASLAKAMSLVISVTGALPILLGTVGIAAAGLNRGFRNLTISILSLGRGMASFGVSANAAKIALRGLTASTLVGGVFMVLGIAIEKLISQYSEWVQKQEEKEVADKKSIESLNTQSKKVEDLTKRYKELSTKNDLTINENTELLKVQNELAELMPSYAAGIDATGQAHLRSVEAINLEIERLKELQKQRSNDEQIKFNNSAKMNFNKIFENKDLIKLNDSYTKTLGFILPDKLKNSLMDDNTLTEFKNKEIYIKLADDLEAYNKSLLQQKELLSLVTKEDQKQIKEKIKAGTEHLKSAKDADDAANQYNKLRAEIQNYSNELVKRRQDFGKLGEVFKNNELENFSTRQKELLAKLSKENYSNAEAWENQRKSLIAAGFSLQETNKIIDHGIKLATNQKVSIEASNEAVESFNNELSKANNEGSKFTASLESIGKELKPLNSALKDVRQGQSLSSESISQLLIQYPELASAVRATTDGYTIETNALEKLINAKKEKAIKDLENEKKSTQATLTNSLARIKIYGQELNGIDSLEKAKSKLEELKESEEQSKNNLGNKVGLFNPFDKRQGKDRQSAIKQLEKYIKDMTTFEDQIKAMQLIVNDPNFGVSPEKKEKKEVQLKDALNFVELEKEVVNSLNETYEARKRLIDLEKKQIDITEKQKDYNSAIEKTNSLIANQIQAVSDLHTANSAISSKADEARMNAVSNKDILTGLKRANPEFSLPSDTEEAKQYVKDYFDTWFDSSGNASEEYKNFINTFAEQSQKVHDNTSLSVENRNKEIEAISKQKTAVEKFFEVQQVFKQGWTENNNKINEMTTAIDASKESLNKLRKEAHDIKIVGLDGQIKEIERTLETIPDSSEEYRTELEKLIQLNKDKQDVEHQTAEEARARIAAGELSAEQIAYENELIQALSNSWWEYQKVIEDNSFKIISSIINESTESVKKYDDQLKISKDRLGLLKEGAKEYTAELQKQINILEAKLNAEIAHEQVIRKQMDSSGLTKQKWSELNQQLKQSILAQIEIASSIKSTNQSLKDQLNTLADDVISIYKEMYEKQKEVALKGIEKELKSLEKSHKAKVDMLDDEMKKYDELAQAKLKLLEETANEEDYQKQLAKLTKERDEIQKQIDKRKLDTSLEGKAKSTELLKELQEKNEEIDDFQKKHIRESEKKSIQDQLEAKKNSVESQKEVADKAYENEKERLDKIKESTEKHYDDLIQDETRFEKIREEIRKGNISKATSDLNGFKSFVLQNSEIMGNGLSNTLIDKISKISTKLQEVSPLVATQFTLMSSQMNETMIAKVDELITKFKELDNLKFGNLASSLTDVSKVIEEMKKNSIDWYSANPDDQRKLEKKNQELGKSIGASKDSRGEWTKDGSQLYDIYYKASSEEQVKIDQMRANSRGWSSADPTRKKELEEANHWIGEQVGATYKNGTWFKQGLPLYRDGGIVGGKGSPSIEHLNQILNRDEKLAILKDGELVVKDGKNSNILSQILKSNPIDYISKIASNIKSFDFSKFSPSSNLAAAGPNVNHYSYNFSIDKVIGDRKGATDFVQTVFNDMKNKGKS